jgi:HD-GYP domain-containing protein (c-di-GMP phosphodiesterase class II)
VSTIGKRLGTGLAFGIFCAIFIGVFAALHRQNLSDIPRTLVAGCAGGLLLGAFLVVRDRLAATQPFDILRKYPALWIVFFIGAGFLLSVIVELTVFYDRLYETPTHKYWFLGSMGLATIVGFLLTFHERTTQHLRFSFAYLERLYMNVIESLVSLVEAKDPQSRHHSERVATLCGKLAERLNLTSRQSERLRTAALLHELGKIGIEEDLLRKPPPLKDEEMQRVSVHPLITQRILQPISAFQDEAAIIARLYRTDGGAGEPHVMQEYSILAAADAYDSMRFRTVRDPAYTAEEALAEMERDGGFLPEIIDALRHVVSESGADSSEESAASEAQSKKEEFNEEEILQSVTRAAHHLGVMDLFYRFLGVSRNQTKRIWYVAVASGVLLGLTAGLTVWAISGQPRHILYITAEGLLIAVLVSLGGSLFVSLTSKAEHLKRMQVPAFVVIGSLAGAAAAVSIMLPLQYPGGVATLYILLFCGLMGALAGGIEHIMQIFARISERLLKSHEALQQSYVELTYALAFALEAKDAYTRGHSDRVARNSLKMGKRLNLLDEDLRDLERAALFHDIGKIGISIDILHKQGKLSDEEFGVIKMHPEIGERILKPVRILAQIAPYVRAHHEDFQGTGYPDRIRQTQIPLYSRIISIADTFDAMISERPYRKGMSVEDALKEMRRVAGGQLDPALVDLFIEILKDEGMPVASIAAKKP